MNYGLLGKALMLKYFVGGWRFFYKEQKEPSPSL